MNEDKSQQYRDLKIEDYIWYIYFFLVAINLYANKLDEENLMGAHNSNQKIKNLHLLTLGIAFLFYIYFVYKRWLKYINNDFKTVKEKETAEIALIASFLFLIGGALFLYAEFSRNIEPEEGIPI